MAPHVDVNTTTPRELLAFLPDLRVPVAALLCAALCYWFVVAYYESRYWKGFPVVGNQRWDPLRFRAAFNYATAGRSIMEEGYKRYSQKGHIFQVMNTRGPILILPIKYNDELRNHPDLVSAIAAQQFFPGYEVFKPINEAAKNGILTKVIHAKLVPALALVTEPVNEESAIAFQTYLPETNDWHRIKLGSVTAQATAQVSSRVLIGIPLCRDEKWLRIAKDYALELMDVAFMMSLAPPALRALVYLLMPKRRQLLKTIDEAYKVIQPEVDKREKIRSEKLARGEKIPKHLDGIDWVLEVSQEHGIDFHIAAAQLVLTLASVHNTSIVISSVMYDVIEHGLIQPLRDEIIRAYTEEGCWNKTTLYKLMLMDSVMKESQRFGNACAIMQRKATSDITLDDGTVIPKGADIAFPLEATRDSTFYENGDEYDGYRYVKLRSRPGEHHRWQFASVGKEQLSFGNGKYACPGRAFASNMIKLMLAHLIMKYDWRFVDGNKPQWLYSTATLRMVDSQAEIEYKSRMPEIGFQGRHYEAFQLANIEP